MRGAVALVTGATGFLGTHLVRALSSSGARVHAISRVARDGRDERAIWHRADLVDRSEVAAVFEATRPDLVFHLAAYGAQPDERDSEAMFDTNVLGSWNVWTSMTPSVRRLIMAGTPAEYGPQSEPARERSFHAPVGAYGATKHAAVVLIAGLARAAHRETVIVRPYGAYGPGDDSQRVIPSVIRGLLRGETVAVTDGSARRDFLYIDDHIDALIRAATTPSLAPGATFNIGSGEGIALRDAFSQIAAAVNGPGSLALGAREYRSDDLRDIIAEIEVARRELGFEPRTPFADGIARTAAWMRQHLASETSTR